MKIIYGLVLLFSITNALKILSLADIHLDLYYGLDTNPTQACKANPAENIPIYGKPGCDSPSALF